MQTQESTMLVVSICNGIPSLLLHALQRSSLHQWDALFVVFGLSFYTIPKITPLSFLSTFLGSWLTAVIYALLAFVLRPPERIVESVLGMCYCVPVIAVFNIISYYSEYNWRERFILRRRLRSESISLALKPSPAASAMHYESADQFFHAMRRTNPNGVKFVFGLLLWAAFTSGGWISLPEPLKFVDEETGWAWFSHCAGVTMFLLVTTRQLLWLFVVPPLSIVLLWMMSLTMPAAWIIISAHSVGYGLLLASVIVAMGVFSWFVCAWKQLVAFLTRSCFLFPQLQAGLENEYPLLVKIVSEYTAGFDPEILSSRIPASRAIKNGDSKSLLAEGVVLTLPEASATKQSGVLVSSLSPRRRAVGNNSNSSTHAVSTKKDAYEAKDRGHRAPSTLQETNHVDAKHTTTPDPEADHPAAHMDHGELDEEALAHAHRTMMSVLPSFKPGKCFFCSKNDAEHFVPACGMWGKWTHWRMNQQQNSHMELTAGTGSSLAKPVVSMCTSYYDIQSQKSELDMVVARLERQNDDLTKQLAQLRSQESESMTANAQATTKMRAMQQRHEMDVQRRETQLQEKMDAVLKESNRIVHDHKLKTKQLEHLRTTFRQQLREQQALVEQADARAIEADKKNQQQQQQMERMERELAQYQAEIKALRSRTMSEDTLGSPLSSLHALNASFASTSSGSASSPVANIRALQPAGRLPYAQFLEIEGLRESSRKHSDVDYAERWRDLLQDSPDHQQQQRQRNAPPPGF